MFAPQQVFERVLVLVLELLRLEVAGLGFHDMHRQIDHILRDFFVLDGVEIIFFLAHLVRVTQRHAQHAFASRLKRNDVFARGEHDLADRHHAFLANGLTNDRERLLTDFAIGHDVIGIAQIKLVDFLTRHEFVDVDHALAFDGDRFELFRFKLDIFAFCHFIAFDDVGVVHLVAAFGVDLLVADTISSLFVDLMEADLFPLGGRRKQCNGAGNERQLQIAFPIRARGHDILSTLRGTPIQRY